MAATYRYADAPELQDLEAFDTWSASFLESAPELMHYYLTRGHDDPAVALTDDQQADAAAEVPAGSSVKGRIFASIRLIMSLPKAVQRVLRGDGLDVLDPFNLWQKLLGLTATSPLQLCEAFHALVGSTATASVPAPDAFDTAVGAVLDGLLAIDAATPLTPEAYRAGIAVKLKTLLFAHPARMRNREDMQAAVNAWDYHGLLQLAREELPPDVVAPRPVARASGSARSHTHMLFRQPPPPRDPTEIALLAPPSVLRPVRLACGILDDDNTSDSESPPPSPTVGKAAARRRPAPLQAPSNASAPARQPRLTTYGQQTARDMARLAEQHKTLTKKKAETTAGSLPAKRRASSSAPSPPPAKRSVPRV
ncbi:hypothetical protein SPRG_04866 [Saprolegnia parasitica CBS 223.65]|uniref:Uncharacterized protein n=1 Tax=Saprolegnia parasitica (strain CBS 223.65) TaxID=695850 RepID=A0A067CG89_SAPPC|nr:hypothetical protein SPRG_04866 [Saprolegnia parasitica CBS 223.65]KDO29749.1 hypothetical protein SPRG_04866 [Saprolegnia parasitica CBS 223.65]|eukprot:XP_012199397.1 hypothetical protein SPRG_04866 [Saprolegnia parasitica CBS 223.65]